jgi:hypothetical protein
LIQQLDPDEVDAKYSNWKMEHLPIVPETWKMKPNAKTKKLSARVALMPTSQSALARARPAAYKGLVSEPCFKLFNAFYIKQVCQS